MFRNIQISESNSSGKRNEEEIKGDFAKFNYQKADI